MDEKGLEYLDRSDGWEVGIGPSVVLLDKGAAQTFATTTAKGDIYAFSFDQQGLMAGIGIEGSKITRFEP
jgi:lipid-binding SYLF domain-containing protein